MFLMINKTAEMINFLNTTIVRMFLVLLLSLYKTDWTTYLKNK